MILQVKIPDDLYNKYQSLHHTRSEDEIKLLLRSRIVKWLDVLVLADPSERSILLGGDDRRALERVFQTTIESAADLIRKTTTLSQVHIGPLSFNLSQGETVRLTEQALFHGWTPEMFFTNTCRELMDRFMEKI